MEKLSKDVSFLRSSDNEALKKKMKEEYLNCPVAVKYLNKLGVDDDSLDKNINKIYSFVRDINYCSKCPGLDKCEKENPSLCTKIIVKNGKIEATLKPCKKLLAKVKFESQFLIRDFDESFLDNSITKLDNSEKRKEVLNKYTDFIKNNKVSWLYLNGNTNSGRSYLASTLAVDLAKRNFGPICYLNVPLRFRQLSDLSMKDQAKFESILKDYSTCQILILDDFGNEYKNDYIRDSILYEIISKRNSSNLFTIFTSDFSLSDIEVLYSTSKAGSIRSKQICKIISARIDKEINLGDLSVYRK